MTVQKKYGDNHIAMKRIKFIFILTTLFSLGESEAQLVTDAQPMPLFQSDELIYLNLRADFKTVFSVKDDSTYFPAELTLTDNDGLERTIDIEIRTRGNTRREGDVCRFPPLRLLFPKDQTLNTPFEGQKAIKLVTHCNDADMYEQNTILEYLIYKAYNVLTDSSFKVRPVIINYINSEKKADTIRKFAFFLEREKHLAYRLKGIEIEAEKIHPNRMNPHQTCMMDIFQYMIGNTDYSIFELHNVVLVSDSARRFPPVPVPYDFDWSGLVSAIYAEPHPLIKTTEVTERVYRGFKKEPFIVNRTIELFKTRKQEIYQLFENYELLNDNEKKKAIDYLDQFYWTINDERSIQKVFIDDARIVHD